MVEFKDVKEIAPLDFSEYVTYEMGYVLTQCSVLVIHLMLRTIIY